MDIQHLSAESSALKTTLAAAEGSINNPFDYTIEKQMPSNAVQWLSHDPVGTNTISSSSSIQFELQRYGYLMGCVFECDIMIPGVAETAGLNGFTTPRNCTQLFPRIIDSIEFHSSSRRLARLSGKDYYALLKNLSNDARVMIATNALCGAEGDFSNTADTNGKFRLPLLFSFFENASTCIDSSFVEPLRVSVRFGDMVVAALTGVKGSPAATDTVNITRCECTNPKLHCEYRTLTRELTDATVESNYSAPLTTYAYDYVDENPKDFTPSQTSSTTVRVPITDSSCVSDIYVYCEKPIDELTNQSTDIATRGIPLPIIESVKLVCSGQSICELSPEVMDLFAYKSLSGGNYWAGEAKLVSSSTHTNINTENVVRIPLAMVHDAAVANTGSLSLRELGNPEIIIQIKSTDAAVTHRAHVILCAQKLISTDPSSGRMVVSVSS